MIHFRTKAAVWHDNRKVYGTLEITDDEVVFRSNDIYCYNVPLKNIVQVSKRQKWIFFDRFMFFRTREGRLYKFFFFRTHKAARVLNYLVHIRDLYK